MAETAESAATFKMNVINIFKDLKESMNIKRV